MAARWWRWGLMALMAGLAVGLGWLIWPGPPGYGPGPMGMHGMFHGMGFEGRWGPMMFGWGGWWMMLFWLLVFGGLAALVVGLLTGQFQQARTTPLQILEERFARGQISEEDFRRMREQLTGK
jgi:putative membrane protein